MVWGGVETVIVRQAKKMEDLAVQNRIEYSHIVFNNLRIILFKLSKFIKSG